MTRTITPPAGSLDSAARPFRAAVATAAGDPAGGAPHRPRSRFPDLSGRVPAGGRGGPRTVLWNGSDGALRELVRDHATAVGLDLIDAHADALTVCSVSDATALVDPADGAGAARAGATSPDARERLPRLLVVDSADVPAWVWRAALALGIRAVLPLPSGSEELLSHLAALARPRSSALLLGVVGGCGGAGASSFAARLAAAARAHGPVSLVDADPLGGGLDLLVEAPRLDGIRWQEAAALGAEDGEALRSGMPQVDEVRLLVSGEGPGPTERTLPAVLSSLAALGGTAVVDLSPALVTAAAVHLDRVLVVTPATDHAVRATARRLRSWQLPDGLARAVVRRRGPLSPGEVGEDLGIPLAAAFRDSSRGSVPLLDVRRRGADRAARDLLAGEVPGISS